MWIPAETLVLATDGQNMPTKELRGPSDLRRISKNFVILFRLKCRIFCFESLPPLEYHLFGTL